MALPAVRVLVICTANQCRSPMGEVIVRHQLELRGLAASVASAGTAASDGIEATDGAVRAVARLGLDLTRHRSRRVTDSMVADADLVVAMEARQLIDLVTEHGADLRVTFTLPELAQLTAAAAPRNPEEPVGNWLARIAPDRDAASALNAAEIEDPIGRSMRHYRSTAGLLVEGFEQVVAAYAGGADGG